MKQSLEDKLQVQIEMQQHFLEMLVERMETLTAETKKGFEELNHISYGVLKKATMLEYRDMETHLSKKEAKRMLAQVDLKLEEALQHQRERRAKDLEGLETLKTFLQEHMVGFYDSLLPVAFQNAPLFLIQNGVLIGDAGF